MMEEDFYATIKLVTGEEIFASVCPFLEDDKTFLILDNPIIIIPIQNKSSKLMGYKVTPWINISDDDMHIIEMKNIVTITEINSTEIISVHQKYSRNTSRVEVTKSMGLISKVNEARELLEKIYNT